jgi:hypothetical protein
MKKITFAILILALTGCSHYYYAPNAANIPLFKEKNNFEFKGGYSGDYYEGADIQMAYSATNNIGVMLNSFFVGKTENVQESIFDPSSHKESGTGSYIEAAAGYYKPFGHNNVWIFETYAGAGVGGEKHVYAYSENARLGLTKFFVQPSLGYSAKKGHFEFAIASRFSNVNLKVKKNNLSSEANNGAKQQLANITPNPGLFFWEPSCMVAAGGKNVKFYLQMTLTYDKKYSYVEIDPGNLSFGIKLNFKTGQKKTGSNND